MIAQFGLLPFSMSFGWIEFLSPKTQLPNSGSQTERKREGREERNQNTVFQLATRARKSYTKLQYELLYVVS